MLAQALQANGQFELALENFEKARRLDPGFAAAHYSSVLLARKLNRAALADSAMDAFEHLQKMAEKTPNSTKEMKQLRGAIMDAPEDPDHHLKLALLFLRHGYSAEALNRFDRVLQLRPQDYMALNHKGTILLRQGDLAAARETFRRALQLAPDFPPAHMNAGNVKCY